MKHGRRMLSVFVYKFFIFFHESQLTECCAERRSSHVKSRHYVSCFCFFWLSTTTTKTQLFTLNSEFATFAVRSRHETVNYSARRLTTSKQKRNKQTTIAINLTVDERVSWDAQGARETETKHSRYLNYCLRINAFKCFLFLPTFLFVYKQTNDSVNKTIINNNPVILIFRN